MEKYNKIKKATDEMAQQCEKLSFSKPVTHVYNPLVYARRSHMEYLKKYANNKKEVLFLGMNPGPWGMAQTGIPFGEINAVKNWMNINCEVGKPPKEHPKRIVKGFDCHRSEVSGKRLWGFFSTMGTSNDFFEKHFVMNYCPLLFINGQDDKCSNVTPDKLKNNEKNELISVCDQFLKRTVEILEPKYLIGVGGFAKKRFLDLFDENKYHIHSISHPSPANPKSNKGYDSLVKKELDVILSDN